MLITAFYYKNGYPSFYSGLEEIGVPEQFTLLPGRYCIGRYENGNYVPCGKRIERGYQCPDCRKKDEKRVFLSFDGFGKVRGWLKERFEKEHVVYLALFGNRVKVGVTLKDRIKDRLLEQGADMGLVIFEGDGFECRQLETQIRALGVRDKMDVWRKFFSGNPKKENLLKVFEELSHIYPLKKGQLYNLLPHYPKIDNPKPLFIRPYMSISNILGFKGEFIYIYPNYVLNAKRIVGKKIWIG